jgi:hypothetical protein
MCDDRQTRPPAGDRRDTVPLACETRGRLFDISLVETAWL